MQSFDLGGDETEGGDTNQEVSQVFQVNFYFDLNPVSRRMLDPCVGFQKV